MSDIIEATFQDPEVDIDHLLSEMPEGYKVQIKRLEPEWCNGVVATVDYDPTEPISAKWIVNRFGGRKYQIKVLDEKSRYRSVRTITFPEVPLKDGAPIEPGPHGAPVLCSVGKTVEPPPPQQDNQMVGMLEKLLVAQQTQANAMTTMLLGRVQGLETLLTAKLTEPAPVNTGLVPPIDASTQMKNTLETVKAIEELRGAIGGSEGGEVDPANPLYDKIIDKLVDKFTAEPQPKQQQQQQQTQTRGNLPPGPIAPKLSNLELAVEIKERLKDMPEEEREYLLSHVLEDEVEETPAIAGQDDIEGLDSLLTQEDEEALKDEKTETTIQPNESQTV